MKHRITIRFLFLLFAFYSFNAIAETDAKELKGYDVKFDYKGHPKEREIAVKYIKDNYKFDYHPFREDQIGIDVFDIDNDGEKEILVYLHNGGYCGSAGCPFPILKKVQGHLGGHAPMGWGEKKNDGLNVHEEIRLLDSCTNGVHDILFESLRGYSIWRWKGSYYDLSETIKK